MTAILRSLQLSCKFYIALQNKNVDLAELLINQGVDVDYRYRIGNLEKPAICIAAQNCDYTMCSLLIMNGCSINQIDSEGMVPLFYACKNGDLNLVKLFIVNGANLQILDMQQKSCLHFAIQGTNIDIIKLLIDHGVCVNCKDNIGNTPLNLAFLATLSQMNQKSSILKDTTVKYLPIILQLINSGSLMMTCNAQGFTPLYYCHALEPKWFLSTLLAYFSKSVNPTPNLTCKEKLNLNIRTKYGETPLHALFNNVENSNHSTRYDSPCLKISNTDDNLSRSELSESHIAHLYSIPFFQSIIKEFKIHNTCLNEKHFDAPLLTLFDASFIYIVRRYYENLRSLFETTSNKPKSLDDSGDMFDVDIFLNLADLKEFQTMLKLSMVLNLEPLLVKFFYATSPSNTHPVNMSLIHNMRLWFTGVDVDCQDNLGHTPLHKAVTNNQFLCAEYLIRLGNCSSVIKDRSGLTAIDLIRIKMDKMLNIDNMNVTNFSDSNPQEDASRNLRLKHILADRCRRLLKLIQCYNYWHIIEGKVRRVPSLKFLCRHTLRTYLGAHADTVLSWKIGTPRSLKVAIDTMSSPYHQQLYSYLYNFVSHYLVTGLRDYLLCHEDDLPS
ncbi:unnamed protein product [Gordionus sp. m RMFG-2023]|uniref:putative ankyrin repeat protein RF_0381 n=1 Tax=Gordionus sp. m RMFG-2023 TaxID=3053472 RepID=UPI0030E02933